MKIGVTGANGFVGKHLCAALTRAGHDVTALVRNPHSLSSGSVDHIAVIPTIDKNCDPKALQTALAGLDAVVHLAARVHDMSANPDKAAFQSVNVEGSVRIFEAATAVGVERLVFLSSVKAAAERSDDTPLSAEETPKPEDIYGRSKLEAETRLRELATKSECKLIILRPAFVYGWPPSGNFRTVVGAVLRGTPLPLGGIDNQRDMTYAGNLADAVLRACESDGLSNTPYFISDGKPVSTSELFRLCAQAFDRPSRLFYTPIWMLRLAGRLTGRSGTIARITENFVVDCTPFHRDAGWQAPYKMSDGLSAVARAWKEANRAGSKST